MRRECTVSSYGFRKSSSSCNFSTKLIIAVRRRGRREEGASIAPGALEVRWCRCAQCLLNFLYPPREAHRVPNGGRLRVVGIVNLKMEKNGNQEHFCKHQVSVSPLPAARNPVPFPSPAGVLRGGGLLRCMPGRPSYCFPIALIAP